MVKLKLPPNPSSQINGISVYNLYLQLKNHFNGRSDVVKRDWKYKVSETAFNKRNDKFFFNNLSSKYNLRELVHIFVGNLLVNSNAWVGDISDGDAIEFYNLYKSRLKMIKSRYHDDIKNIYAFAKKMELSSLGEMFVYNDSARSSYIFKMLQSNIISYETFIMLDSFLNFIDEFDKKDDIVWMNYSVRIKAYRKLLDFSSIECKSYFVEVIKSVKF